MKKTISFSLNACFTPKICNNARSITACLKPEVSVEVRAVDLDLSNLILVTRGGDGGDCGGGGGGSIRTSVGNGGGDTEGST